MIYGYVWVSTQDQSVDSQKHSISRNYNERDSGILGVNRMHFIIFSSFTL